MTESPILTRGRSPGSSQTDVVVRQIKAMIVDGRLQAGSRLPVEHDLAAALGVSRGSLREGVRALVMMGVLETRQGDGTYVTSLDIGLLFAPMSFVVDLAPGHRMRDLAAVRRVLETEAAARAALRITPAQLAAAQDLLEEVDDLPELAGRDDEHDHARLVEADLAFHRIIAQAADNPVLEALIEGLAGRSVQTRLWRSASAHEVVAAAHRQHLDILAALRSADPERARILMAAHLLVVEDLISAGSDCPESVASCTLRR